MFDDRSLITAEHLAALRPMLRHPTRYTQRLVEHLDFLPHGGQRWRRDLQILIPKVASVPPTEDHWVIVSLGQFIRRRLPDFTVTDCSGRTVNLLTRVQHGHCLAELTIDRYLLDRERDAVAAASGASGAGLKDAYAKVYLPTFDMFTSVRDDLAPVAESNLTALLEMLEEPEGRARRRAALFMKSMTEISKVTQYLCWVRARPEIPVRLTATYTMPDPARLAGPDPSEGSTLSRFGSFRVKTRTWRSEQYARFGLGPVRCTFPTPANDHAASYYFSFEPPPESNIPYLDWGLDNTIEADGREWVCAHNSVHVHNGAELRTPGETPKPRVKIPNSKIYAFLRLDPADHKQVMFAAVLNVIFVWLAEAGRLSPELEGTTAPWLALAPAVLLAYTAQQRRHYYARPTRWVRIVLWLYLLLNIAFLVSISFDIASSSSFAARHGFGDDAVSILMAGTSIVVFWLFAFLGQPYEWFVGWSFKFERWRTARKAKKKPGEKTESTVHSYVRVARWYGNMVVLLILISLVGMAGVLLAGWGPSPPSTPDAPAVASPKQHKQGSPTSGDAKGTSAKESSGSAPPPGTGT